MRKMALCIAVLLIFSCQYEGHSQSRIADPVITTTPAQNGALIVHLASTDPHGAIYYTVDGTMPGRGSQRYEAPFLVVSKQTVKAVAASADQVSAVVERRLSPRVTPGALVWSDEFAAKRSKSQPDPAVWTYDTGDNGFGNHELENYCAWGSDTAPCSANDPSAYVATDGYLHVVAKQVRPSVYTSARLKSQGLFSFQYGRFEVRARVPEGQGLWPAVWLLGNNIATEQWPACGEQDVLERVNAAESQDWNEGSVHGPGFIGDAGLGTVFHYPPGQSAAEWHTYGMIWQPGSVAYYVDDPKHPFVTYTKADLKHMAGAVWPFDSGQSNFILVNLAVGGDWPKAPDATTQFPAEMDVDYVRIYAN